MAVAQLKRYFIGRTMQLASPRQQRHSADASALSSTMNRLQSAYTLTDVMEIVTHAARLLLAADGITLVLREGDRCYYAEEDAISPLWKGSRFPMDMCISGWCMKHEAAVAIPDIYADDRIPHDAYRPTFVKSLAMVPVLHGEAIAAMGSYWASRYDAGGPDIALLQTIADAAAPAISRTLHS